MLKECSNKAIHFASARNQHRDPQNNDSIITDVMSGNEKAVKKWLYINRNENRSTLSNMMSTAALYDQESICKWILNTGRLRDGDIKLALCNACSMGYLPIVNLLIKHCKLERNPDLLHDAIQEASIEGHVRVVKRLQTFVKLSITEFYKLLFVSYSGRGTVNKVNRLIKALGDEDTAIFSDALRGAACKGRLAVVNLLLSYTLADISKLGPIGMNDIEVTSLTAACYGGHYDVIMRLGQVATSQVINMDCGARDGDTALHLVILCNIISGKNSRYANTQNSVNGK